MHSFIRLLTMLLAIGCAVVAAYLTQNPLFSGKPHDIAAPFCFLGASVLMSLFALVTATEFLPHSKGDEEEGEEED